MAFLTKRKLLLDATSRPETSFSNFTKTYRTSNNVEDRRGERQAQAESDAYIGMKRVDKITPPKTKDGSTGSGMGGPADGYDDGATGYDHSAPSTQTRKVSPEEAIDKTFNRR